MSVTMPPRDGDAHTASRALIERRALGSVPEHAGAPLRILHIFRAPLGGLFRHVCDLAHEQTRMGHDVGIVCDSSTGGFAAERQFERLRESCTLGVTRIGMSRLLAAGDIAVLAALRGIVVRLDPDVLHGHGAKGGAYARLMPREKRRIALYTPHGGALHYAWSNPAGVVFLGLERLLMRHGDGILFESQFSEHAYARKVGRPQCATRVVSNGLSANDFAGLDDAEPVFDAVFVGELRKLKGVSVLIEACARLARERDFKLGIAGSGPDETQFRAEAAAKGLNGKVEFLGHRPARTVFAMGRMIVVPSLAESFPYVVLEAAASSRPLIATNVGGIPEIFGPFAGALVTPGDPDALAQAMARTLDAPGRAHALALALKQRAQMLFSAPRMAREVTRFYGELSQSQQRVKPKRSVKAEAIKVRETTAV
jgi:glycosyltransferase involved in cell wall biosynthesis